MARSIPVDHGPRTLAQRHRNRLHNLERVTDNQDVSNGGNEHDLLPFTTIWPHSWDNWIDRSWRNFDRDLERMQRNMFALLPIDNFGMDSWAGLHALPDPLSTINRMERDIEDMRRRFGVTDAPQSGALSDFMKDAYELDENGKLRFAARFGANGFAPDDINVTSTDKQLSVHAKKVVDDGKSKKTREFCRIISLPDAIDSSQIQCHLTQDGVLSVEAPVKAPEHKYLTFTENGQLAIRPKSEDQIKQLENSEHLAVKGLTEPTVIDEGDGKRRLQVEIPIDPGFKLDDVHVSVGAHSINVHGKRKSEKRSHDSHSNYRSAAEFSCSYEIPETVDPLTVNAGVVGNTLVISAPLSRMHRVKMTT